MTERLEDLKARSKEVLIKVKPEVREKLIGFARTSRDPKTGGPSPTKAEKRALQSTGDADKALACWQLTVILRDFSEEEFEKHISDICQKSHQETVSQDEQKPKQEGKEMIEAIRKQDLPGYLSDEELSVIDELVERINNYLRDNFEKHDKRAWMRVPIPIYEVAGQSLNRYGLAPWGIVPGAAGYCTCETDELLRSTEAHETHQKHKEEIQKIIGEIIHRFTDRSRDQIWKVEYRGPDTQCNEFLFFK